MRTCWDTCLQKVQMAINCVCERIETFSLSFYYQSGFFCVFQHQRLTWYSWSRDVCMYLLSSVYKLQYFSYISRDMSKSNSGYHIKNKTFSSILFVYSIYCQNSLTVITFCVCVNLHPNQPKLTLTGIVQICLCHWS